MHGKERVEIKKTIKLTKNDGQKFIVVAYQICNRVLDFCVRSVLGRKACATPATSVKILKKRLVKAWAEIDQKIFPAVIDDFLCRLRAVIKSKGDHFE